VAATRAPATKADLVLSGPSALLREGVVARRMGGGKICSASPRRYLPREAPAGTGGGSPNRMPAAELSNATLYYEMEPAGGGPELIRLLAIGGTDSDLRRPPSPFGWPGAERFSILAYDHRDLGRSRSRAPAPTEHLGWSRFAVLGISFGGMVAQELALLAGERVERLVLAVTSGGGSLGSSFPLHELYALDTQERVQKTVELLDTRAAESPELASALRAFVTHGGVPPAAPAAGLLRQLEARREHDVSTRIGALRIPCLLVAGRYDGLAPAERSARLAAAIPGASVEVLDGGRGLLLQDPAAWPLIAGFLSGSS
jgi:3-oxoadipate enol-lactonase